MTTYYVDFTNGSDSNNGLGPDASHSTNKPWKTATKAMGASGIASGDTLYLAPGIFRETVSVAMTSPTAETFVRGDPTNARGFKTSGGVVVDPAPVIVTNYTTNWTTTPTSTTVWTNNGRNFLTVENISFLSGVNSTSVFPFAFGSSAHDCKLRRCAILAMGGDNSRGISLPFGDGITHSYLIEECFILAVGNVVSASCSTAGSVDWNASVTFKNCVMISPQGQWSVVSGAGAGTGHPGGVLFTGCTFMMQAALAMNSGASTQLGTATYPVVVENCVLIGGGLSAGTTGQIIEDYNVIYSAVPRTNVTAGSHSHTNDYAPAFEAFGYVVNKAPSHRPLFQPIVGSPWLGFGSGSNSPGSVDLLGRARPEGGGSTSLAVGAMERHDTAVREVSVVDASGSGLKIVGPGSQRLAIPVQSISTTISIKVRYDTNHNTTNKPQAILLAADKLGVSAETLTATAAVDTWETLTFSAFTPNAKGIVYIDLVSRSAAGNGIAYFDTLVS